MAISRHNRLETWKVVVIEFILLFGSGTICQGRQTRWLAPLSEAIRGQCCIDSPIYRGLPPLKSERAAKFNMSSNHCLFYAAPWRSQRLLSTTPATATVHHHRPVGLLPVPGHVPHRVLAGSMARPTDRIPSGSITRQQQLRTPHIGCQAMNRD